jgi:hypothetical protein
VPLGQNKTNREEELDKKRERKKEGRRDYIEECTGSGSSLS